MPGCPGGRVYQYMYLLSTHVLLMNKRYRLNINLLSGNTGLHIYNLFEVETSVAESLKHRDPTLHMQICICIYANLKPSELHTQMWN